VTQEIVQLQKGPQQDAARSTARVIFYGGARGGGKTRWLVHETAKFCENPRYGAVIFRRTYPELKGTGSIWEEAGKIYPLLGAEMTDSALKSVFPSGSTVQFSHLQHDKDASKWQGKSLAAIGFDELTHFTEAQFWFLFSSLRSVSGVSPRLRATMNPDPDSWVLQFVGWYIDEAGFAIPERSGVVRWFGRIDGKLRWFASELEAQIQGVETPTSFTFIAAKVFDNPALMKADPEYLAKLRALPPVEQARFLGGNWKVRASAGDYFQEAYFPRIPTSAFDRKASGLPSPTDILRSWRCWDLAGTPVEGDTVIGAPRETRTTAGADRKDADWTRGIKFGELRDGRLILLDMRSARDSPGAIEWLIRRTAERDGRHVVQTMWKDPAQAGVHQVATYERLLRGAARFATCDTMDPLAVAGTAARRAWKGDLLVPADAPWWEEAIRELETFPLGKHDDVTSALGQGCIYQLEFPGAGGGRVLPATQETLEDHYTKRQGRTVNDLRGLTGKFKAF
jgi:predicted phage terminase large subunit-like protein